MLQKNSFHGIASWQNLSVILHSVLLNAPIELLSWVVLSPCPCLVVGFVFARHKHPLIVLFRFPMGVDGFPTDAGQLRGMSHHRRHCDLCHMSVVGNEHHISFTCPSLPAVRQCFRHLDATGTLSLRQFVWREDLCDVVRFVCGCLA